MLKQHFFYSVLLLLFLTSCKKTNDNLSPLETALASKNLKIKRVMDSLYQHEVQILYTEIERKNGEIQFKDYSFQLDSTQYFYPASTVKLPIALLTLSKLNSLESMDRNTRFFVEGDTLENTFTQEIKKIFTVSDNEAYNRLFEFLGQDYINKELNRLQLGPIRISHRLSTSNAEEITTKPLIIFKNDSTTTILPSTINTSATAMVKKRIKKGVGFYKENAFVNEPFDFSLKNYYPIQAQHELLKRIVFPKMFKENKKINLSQQQLNFIQTAMRALPKNEDYDSSIFYDGYCKFLLFGDTTETIPEHIEIYNKVGDAYGTLTDCAYIKDTKNDIEFMVTATILANKNGVFNDDIYEYDEVGLPFLAQLGRELYAIELDRKD